MCVVLTCRKLCNDLNLVEYKRVGGGSRRGLNYSNVTPGSVRPSQSCGGYSGLKVPSGLLGKQAEAFCIGISHEFFEMLAAQGGVSALQLNFSEDQSRLQIDASLILLGRHLARTASLSQSLFKFPPGGVPMCPREYHDGLMLAPGRVTPHNCFVVAERADAFIISTFRREYLSEGCSA